MNTCFASVLLSILFVVPLAAAQREVPPQERDSIDRIIGGKGTFVPDEGAYKVILPREAATIVQDYQTLSPNLGLNSWAAFSPAIHEEAVLTGQFLLLDNEVNSVLSAALDAGLEVTGLASSSVFDGPRLYTLDVSGQGTFKALAAAFRKGIDAMYRVHRASISKKQRWIFPSVPMESTIDGQPLDAVLSMKGTIIYGVYKAAIGKRAMIQGEVVGRTMGFSTWMSFAGTNDRAIAQGEFIESPNDLQKVLKALRAKGINIESIRNHTAGEHPQFVFVRFWAQGTALELAKALRHVLNVEVGLAPSPAAL